MRSLLSLPILIAALGAIAPNALAAPQETNSATPVAANDRPPAQLLEEGKQAYQSGQFARAAEVLDLAARQFTDNGTPSDRAQALNYLALAQKEIGRPMRARETVAASIELLTALPELQRAELLLLAQAFNHQAHIEFARAQPESALQGWQQAEAIYDRLDDATGKLGSQINQAQALQALGSARSASQLLAGIEATLTELPNSRFKIDALLSLGNVLRATGDLEQSRQVLEEGLATAALLELPAAASAAQLSLGNTLRLQERDDPSVALDFYARAAASAPNEIARTRALSNTLNLVIATENWSTVAPTWQQIQAELSALPLNREAIEIRINAANNLLTLTARQPSLAPPIADIANQLAVAVGQARTLGDDRILSYALGTLGRAYERDRQWEQAETLTNQALLLAQNQQASHIAYRWQWQLGRLHRAQSDIPGAIALYSQSVETLQSLRGELAAASADVQFSFRDDVEPVYRQLASLLLRSETPSQEELRQARNLIESLRVAELDSFFRDDCVEVVPVAIDNIDPGTAVIYPIVLEDRLAVILSMADRPLQYYSTPLSEATVEKTLQRFSNSLLPFYRGLEQPGREIYDWLIRPAEDILSAEAVDTLVFVPDGGFRNISFAALSNGEQYLIENYNLALSPGLELLPLQDTTGEALSVLAAGLSEGRQGFPPLPAVRAELEDITSLIPSNRQLLDRTFTSTSFTDALGEMPASILHLATHGQFGSSARETFVLTWDEQLDIKELGQLLQIRRQNSDVALELLVLSACDTATGDDRATLGIAGMAVRSGARSTLAGLWPLGDAAAARFMAEFYRALAVPGTSRAQATRTAQLTLLRDPQFADPFLWAPFVLVGNWL